MARSINSPGVQIVETDLSNYQQIGGGTVVYVAGFAPQGPTDETLRITSISELEQVYGIPQTAAERYFYHTSKQILNSPASLLTTRLPYGSGLGDGFANNYSALLFPTTSANNEIRLGEPKYIILSEEQYNNIAQGNFTWGSLSAANTFTTTVTTVSSRTATSATSAAVLAQIQLVDPTPGTYSIQYNNSNVTFTFEVTGLRTNYNDSSIANYDGTTVNAGLVVLNTSKTAINEQFEGYYISVTDNSEFGANSDFTAVNRLYSLSAANDNLNNSSYAIIPNTRLSFALSGTKDTAGSNSVSEVIEGVVDFQLNQEYYNDTLVVNLYKVRNSIYEPQRLTYSIVETHLGSLDANKKTLAPIGGIQQSFFLETVVNQKSNNIKVLVNPNISKKLNWVSSTSDAPSKNVRVDNNVKAIFPHSVYLPSYYTSNNKQIGDLPKKIERVLSFVEATENIDLDIVVDGGLSTIYANTTQGADYDEARNNDLTELLNPSSDTVTDYKVIYTLFNNFVSNTRKDCVFIADPLRQIFINGENTKVLSLRDKTFSQNIYTPLKNLFESANSNYSVTYGNWVKAYDPFADKQVWLPFSGFAAAAYARTDANNQPWIAPAGLTRGLINGILDLGFNPNQKQRDFLYTLSVNPVVFFSGDGYAIFGQKTLQNKPSAFDRVNVRRLFLVLERATQNALKYFVFEPNSDFTRTRLKNTIVPVFELAKNTEGLYDYLIICDERNNTPELVDRNELAVDVYIKPVKAAEFILVNFIATRTGQNFNELV